MTDIQNNINTRFIKSACDGNIDEMKILIDLGADIHKDNDEALRLCVKYFHIEAAKLLLEKGVDINACVKNGDPNEEGKTALHYAAQAGHIEMVVFLLDNKADIEQKSNLKQNALHFAVNNNKIETVKLLLERGANIHAKGGIEEKEEYALLLCVLNYYPEMTKILLEKGADVNVNDDYILVTCAQYHHVEVFEILLKAGANASNHMAMNNALKTSNECVKLLIKYGADLSKNSDILKFCSIYNIEIIKIIINHGAIYTDNIDIRKPTKEVIKVLFDNKALTEKVDKLQKQLDDIKQVII